MTANTSRDAHALFQQFAEKDKTSETVRITRSMSGRLLERVIELSTMDQSEEGREKTRILEGLRPR